jgi:hypothetical protein
MTCYRFRYLFSVGVFCAFFIGILACSCKKADDPETEEPGTEEPESPSIPPQDVELLFLHSHEAPESRKKMASATDGVSFYVGGGHHPMSYTSSVYKLDMQTFEWTSAPLSKPRMESFVHILDNQVFVSGGWHGKQEGPRIDRFTLSLDHLDHKVLGTGDFSYRAVTVVGDQYLVVRSYANFYIFDHSMQAWETIAIDPIYQGTVQSIISDGNTIYSCNLTTNDFNTKHVLLQFDLKSRIWTEMENKAHHLNNKMLTHKGKIYFYSTDAFETPPYLDVYDIKDQRWSTLRFPEYRELYAILIDEPSDALILSGGRVLGDEESGSLMSSDLLVYQFGNEEWKKFKLQHSRLFHTMQIVGDRLVVHGGEAVLNVDDSIGLPTEIFQVSRTEVQ